MTDGQAEAEPQNRFTLWAPLVALLILNSVNCKNNQAKSKDFAGVMNLCSLHWQILRCVRSEADMQQAEAQN